LIQRRFAPTPQRGGAITRTGVAGSLGTTWRFRRNTQRTRMTRDQLEHTRSVLPVMFRTTQNYGYSDLRPCWENFQMHRKASGHPSKSISSRGIDLKLLITSTVRWVSCRCSIKRMGSMFMGYRLNPPFCLLAGNEEQSRSETP
jgi:hypothetical protein